MAGISAAPAGDQTRTRVEGAARQQPGSWWEDWQAWIERQNADVPKVPARIPRNTIEDAPGRYAKLRVSARPKT